MKDFRNETNARIEEYEQARKIGARQYNKSVSNGFSGYLPSLEELLKNIDIASEYNIGIIEIPLRKIVGTYSNLRSLSFSNDFMPLIDSNTEFQAKWSNLAEAHLTDGIRDPIKVYEYLNYYYVIEGNKRVSVLKYFGAYSIYANVIRLIPKRNESDLINTIYYEFMEFNNETGITSIWFSKTNRFPKLLTYLKEFSLNENSLNNKEAYKYFENYIYFTFRKIYHELGGGDLPITTGDAFLEYLNLYGIGAELNEKNLKLKLGKFILEVEALSKKEIIDLQTSPKESSTPKVLSTLSNFILPKKKLQIAFVYAHSIENSCWSYSHEIGRRHIQQIFNDQIETYFFENIPEDDTSYDHLVELAKKGFDIIITTSPEYITATLKASLDFTNIKFFNCSDAHFLKHVSTYWGRLHEPKFLTGTVAGVMTKTNIIGYVASHPLPDVIGSINAFALGVKFINPYAKIKLLWSGEWKNGHKSFEANQKLIEMGADIISNYSSLIPQEFSKELGFHSSLYTINSDKKCNEDYLAAGIWHWGVFYENILRHILNGTWKNISFNSNPKMITNFWWGMDSGVVDINYSQKALPLETQKLIKFMRSMIIKGELKPFTGPIYDQSGKLRISEDEFASNEQILAMDWLVDSVDGELPLIDI